MPHDMADQSNQSQGMKFAVDLLRKHGWTEGKGLGKHEDGISEALKVRVKSDATGVGHDPAEQFTFHWWDHVFNKTASSISVEPDQDGVQVKKLTADNTSVSNKKPRKALTYNNMLYGRFIKTATLMSGGEKPVEEASSPDTSDSSEDEDAKLDLSSATKLTDEDLMKVCGGRTAHKGARHGLTMSAKLLRIEEQERAFLEKYGKKEPSKLNLVQKSTAEDTGVGLKLKKQIDETDDGGVQDISSEILVPKKKKKKKKRKTEDCEEEMENKETIVDQHSTEEGERESSKKKKKRLMVDHEVEEEMIGDQHSIEEENKEPTKKKKRRKQVDCGEKINKQMVRDQYFMEEENVEPTKKKDRKTVDHGGKAENGKTISDVSAMEEYTKSMKKKKQRKMVDRESVEEEMELNGLTEDSCLSPEEGHIRPEKKKKQRTDGVQEHGKEDGGEQRENTEKEEGKSKKKKKRKTKDHEEKAEDEEPASATEDGDVKIRKKKKNKH